jgi:hypothetical protein
MFAVLCVRMLIEFVVVTSWNCMWKQVVSVEVVFDLVLCTSKETALLSLQQVSAFHLCKGYIHIMDGRQEMVI